MSRQMSQSDLSGTELTQRDVVDFLTQSKAYGISENVEVIATHISRVFLCGDRAYKLKRAVQYSYVDFSTLGARRKACEEEVRLNRRTAPELYLRAAPITKMGENLSLEGDGEEIDWVVVMRRFDQAMLFDRLAQAGKLDVTHMEMLAERLAAFYRAAEIDRRRGGGTAFASIAREALRNIEKFSGGHLASWKIRDLDRRMEAQLQSHAPLLDARRDAGWIRRCHGDLHLRNIVLLDDGPAVFDCIEFNDDFAVIDVAYDIAFLLMDLEHRALRRLANAFMNRMLDHTGDVEGLALSSLFLALRASIRCHVEAAQNRMEAAREYLDLALSFLEPEAPVLVAVGGLSGCGKSTLARRVAPDIGVAPGAAILRSDAFRKHLVGVDIYQRLSSEHYSKRASERVYAELLAGARRLLAGGHAVVLDAVFADAAERHAACRLADEMGVRFIGLWIDAPLAVREARIKTRSRDASDANVGIARTQETYPIGPLNWVILDGTQDSDALEIQAMTALAVGSTSVPERPWG